MNSFEEVLKGKLGVRTAQEVLAQLVLTPARKEVLARSILLTPAQMYTRALPSARVAPEPGTTPGVVCRRFYTHPPPTHTPSVVHLLV